MRRGDLGSVFYGFRCSLEQDMWILISSSAKWKSSYPKSLSWLQMWGYNTYLGKEIMLCQLLKHWKLTMLLLNLHLNTFRQSSTCLELYKRQLSGSNFCLISPILIKLPLSLIIIYWMANIGIFIRTFDCNRGRNSD